MKKAAPRLFDGMSFWLSCLPPSREKVFRKIIPARGGALRTSPPSSSSTATTSSSCSSSPEMVKDFIITEKAIPMQLVCKKMKMSCVGLPYWTRVVKCSWLEESLQKGELMDYTSFLVEEVPDSKEIVKDSCGQEKVVDNDKSNRGVTSKRLRSEDDSDEPSSLSKKNDSVRDFKKSKTPSSNFISQKSKPICAGIILSYEDKIFMVQPTGSNGWGIPKGGVELHESAEDAARREFLEETGIVLKSCASCCSSGKLDIFTNSNCSCEDGNDQPISLKFLEGSGADIKNGKKIHAFVCNGHGEEVFVGSNLIEDGFRKGQPENSNGRYISIKEALHERGGVVHKNQRRLIEIYASQLKK